MFSQDPIPITFLHEEATVSSLTLRSMAIRILLLPISALLLIDLTPRKEIFMKKTICITLALALFIPIMMIPASANDVQNQDMTTTAFVDSMPTFFVEGDGCRIVSLEYLSNEDAEKGLPDAMKAALNAPSSKDYSPYGTSIPSSSSTWNLSLSAYSFTVDTTYSVIYSNYVFTNHGGTALLRCHDTSGTANMGTEYYATIFVRTRTGGTLAGTIAMIRGSDSALYVNNLNDSDKIYFSINPDGRRVKIGSGAGTLEGS